MPTITFEVNATSSCSAQIIFPSGGGVLNIPGTFSFPWTFNPLLYDRSTDELNATYLFNCDGCDYTVLVSDYIVCSEDDFTYSIGPSITNTPTPTITSTPTPTPTLPCECCGCFD
ncbi:hypothetical protein EBU71_07305 [bacterium]|jgi:hypothetical protein|nr:hypothetical protein [Candidatus Elulimicrobium humile]